MKCAARNLFSARSAVFFTAALLLTLFCFSDISAQRRGKVYNRFDHNVAAHSRQSCSECHKSPTGVSSAKTETGENYRYPDVTDYPDHDACINCHRQQFFRGARPAICTICHTKVSPRDKVRFSFPKENQAEQFTIRFPHNVHQDIIAKSKEPSGRETNVAAAHFVNATFNSFASFQDDKKVYYNNCTICHAPGAAKTYTTAPRRPQMTELETGVVAAAHREKISAVVGYFKGVPTGHDSCFNCHYSEQKPTRSDCAGCHIPSRNRTVESNIVERYSLKFNHEERTEAGTNPHDLDCTSCHLRITKSSELRTLKPDVPIFTCATCHSKELKPEISQRQNKEIKSCSYCHSAYIGSFEIPQSHLDIR